MFSALLRNLLRRNYQKQRSLIHIQREEFEAEALIWMSSLSRPLIFDQFLHQSLRAAKMSGALLTEKTFRLESLLLILELVLPEHQFHPFPLYTGLLGFDHLYLQFEEVLQIWIFFA